jgi:hypothetical protein
MQRREEGRWQPIVDDHEAISSKNSCSGMDRISEFFDVANRSSMQREKIVDPFSTLIAFFS